MTETIDRVVVLKLAKTLFNGFKHTYNTQQNEAMARKELFQNQESHCLLRRTHVSVLRFHMTQ
jgi:hypothetical protein